MTDELINKCKNDIDPKISLCEVLRRLRDNRYYDLANLVSQSHSTYIHMSLGFLICEKDANNEFNGSLKMSVNKAIRMLSYPDKYFPN